MIRACGRHSSRLKIRIEHSRCSGSGSLRPGSRILKQRACSELVEERPQLHTQLRRT